ncbi:helix-turn-helix domain-containing protein [Parvibacter caecicola]|uniref:helix-turn-helix domain-containing protein n=1 Tax=Parvibacter caecicola TaxID=747645 RepID=UPI00249AE687|nr:helix-turn-helix transcriptional regulator [Parvibacter caecicola]
MDGKKLKRIRMERGMTRRQVEDVTGISQGTIMSLECGKTTGGNIGTAVALAKCYGVTVDELLADDGR